ncbi:MAG: isocitrate/isopropylmalate dehydrogenase family protein [Methanomassiliicoccales archaeon]
MLRIAVVPGDGIGEEVIGEAVKVLEALAETDDLRYEPSLMNIGAARFLETGELLTEADIDALRGNDAILFGAIGDPRVAPGVLEKGILLALRAKFDQYVNHRPVKSWHPFTPLKGERDFDIDFLRENTEDMYMGACGTFRPGKREADLRVERALYRMDMKVRAEYQGDQEFAFELGLHSRQGLERFAQYVMDFARDRGEDRVTAVDKANVCRELYGLWRTVFREKAEENGIGVDFMFVDAMAMALVRRPEDFGVVATPNMFGDILTDLGAELQGGVGLAASGNINPSGVSMFEPVHGSAPDITGQGKANPFGAILAVRMMLEHFGRGDMASRVEGAVRRAMAHDVTTPDLGGSYSTDQVGRAVREALHR